MSDLIRRKEATTIPVMPVEHREYQTMNLDDAYELGWFDCQKCIEELPPAQPERASCKQVTGKLDLISRQDAIDAIAKCTNCNTPKDLREYVAEHSLWSLWSGGVLEALEAVECLPPTPLYTPDEIQTMQDLEWAQLEKMYELGKVGSNWISCKVRVPESYADVLVWFEYYRYGSYNRLYQTYGIGTYSENYDSWTINHESGWHKLRVIAWMPLPEPYRGEGGEE